MSKEIVEAVHVLEREKGISAERLMAALEDALLSAYKKLPGAGRYARVDIDHETGDFRKAERKKNKRSGPSDPGPDGPSEDEKLGQMIN